MKLGLVTYNLANDWSCDTLIERCKATGFQGVELRTTHGHGVEDTLSASERDAVRKQFADAGIDLVGLGTAFEYHAKDADVVRQNIEGTKSYVKLAKDLGMPGIKVRPNGVHEDEPVEKTMERIGKAGRECAAFAADLGIEIRMEVHGHGSCKIENMKMIVDAADHPNFRICWNCNPGETIDGSIEPNFNLLKDHISLVHIQDIGITDRYPWAEMFTLLKGIGYDGYCCAEIQPIDQPERLMHYYRTLWDFYQQTA